MFTPFLFYTFVADLNELYKKIQDFFFRSGTLTLILPSLALLSALGFLLIPKLFETGFSKDLFVFVGGVSFTVHLIYVARQSKGTTFFAFIDYLFNFSLLCILNLILFGLYLNIGCKLPVVKVVAEASKKALSLITELATSTFK
nr:hypothetical protein JG3_0110 [uncultured bacterium]